MCGVKIVFFFKHFNILRLYFFIVTGRSQFYYIQSEFFCLPLIGNNLFRSPRLSGVFVIQQKGLQNRSPSVWRRRRDLIQFVVSCINLRLYSLAICRPLHHLTLPSSAPGSGRVHSHTDDEHVTGFQELKSSSPKSN